MLGEKPSLNMVGMAMRMAAGACVTPEKNFVDRESRPSPKCPCCEAGIPKRLEPSEPYLDMEGIQVPEVLKNKVVVVDSGTSVEGLADACRKAQAEGKETVVVVDSYSELSEPPSKEDAAEMAGGSAPLRRRWEIQRNEEKMAMAFIAAAGGWMGADSGLYGLSRGYERTEPKPTKCGLPGCEKKSVKDYCCAEHCREHRRLRRAGK